MLSSAFVFGHKGGLCALPSGPAEGLQLMLSSAFVFGHKGGLCALPPDQRRAYN